MKQSTKYFEGIFRNELESVKMLILRNGLPYLGKLVAFKPDVGIVVLKIESHKPEFVDIDIDEIVAVHRQ